MLLLIATAVIFTGVGFMIGRLFRDDEFQPPSNHVRIERPRGAPPNRWDK
jgi:hypothetical protein